MKRIGVSLLLTAGLLALAASCDPLELSTPGNGKRALADFQFGYVAKTSMLEKILGIPEQFTTFNTQETYDQLKDKDTGEDAVLRNKFEYTQDAVRFEVHPSPTSGVTVTDIVATSSDTSVVRIVSTDTEAVTVEVKTLGDVDIYVKVSTKKNYVEHVYPIRVVGTVDLRFRITPFWLRKVATKIRMNTRSLPEGVKDMLMWTKDSVTVVGYCEWYDFENFGREPQVIRDTTTYPMEEFWCHYKKWTLYMLRDITDAIRKYSEMSIEGTKIVTREVPDGNGAMVTKTDTVKYEYQYIPEEVILSYLAVTDNPFIEFVSTIKCKKTFDTFPEGEEPDDWYEESDDIGDEVEDPSIAEDDEEETELERQTKNYFKVEINDFMTKHQRDSVQRRVAEMKKAVGFDEDLSEEEKDKATERCNKYL